jgi:sterol desaturase/sphingolipid hydroxylase (fatty acid hydroxylase superfamily)
MGILDFTDDFEAALERWDGRVEAPSPENRHIERLVVFRNPFIENVLATSHPALPGVWFGGFVAYGLFVAGTGTSGPAVGILLFGSGALAFSLLEYLLHRFPFHLDPGETRAGKVTVYLMHGYHHQFPNDKWRLVAPPLLSWPIAVCVATTQWLLFGTEWMWILFGGTCVGYLAYDWIHYYTHHFRSPKTWVGKKLRRAHAVHHYKLFHLNMGISSPLWDLVFGTFAWSDSTVREAMAETRRLESQQARGVTGLS